MLSPSFIAVAQAVVGAALLYMAFFLNEKEERDLNERLVEWWIYVDDTATAAVAWHTRLFRAASGRVVQLFGFIFGERLLTLRAFWASIFLSGAVYVLVLGSDEAVSAFWRPVPTSVLSIVFLITGVLPALGSEHKILLVGYVMLAATWITRVLLAPTMYTWGRVVDSRSVLLTSYVSILASAALFLVVVSVIRKLLSISMRTVSTISQAFLIICELLSVILLLSPLLMLADVSSEGAASVTLLSVATQSMFAGIAAACFVLLHAVFVFLLAVHRMFWPLLRRPLYAAQRYKLFANRQLLASAGTLLLLASGFSWLKRLVGSVLQPLGLR